MIPKIIHYCWFGGKPLPKEAKRCIASWRKYLPDYEIKEWNESNFDVNVIPYTAEAYQAKKYAFVSDYARLYVLHKQGGLYFDTDVEVIRNMDPIIAAGPFMGCEEAYDAEAEPADMGINPGLGIGLDGPDTENSEARKFYEELLEGYQSRHFSQEDPEKLITIVEYTTKHLCEHGLKHTEAVQTVAGIQIYPKEYFCPIDYFSRKCNCTVHSVCIHHFSESWLPWHRKLKDRLYKQLILLFGKETVLRVIAIYKRK